MTGKSFVENHSQLFQDAIFDRDVVSATRWLTYTFQQEERLRDALRRNPYTVGAYLVAVHMHASALIDRDRRWEHFDPDLDEVAMVGMLWRLTAFEIAMVGMGRHIKGNVGQRVLADPKTEVRHVRSLGLVLGRAWIAGVRPTTDTRVEER